MIANSAELGRKVVLLTVFVAVAAMFVTSFNYRMNHPNLFVQVQAAHTADDGHDHGDQPVPPPGMGGSMSQVKEFMDRVEKNPDDVDALVNLGKAFLMMRAWDRAIDPLEKAQSLQPENTEVLKALGIAYFNKEDFTKASAAYDAILRITPEDSLALFNQGVIFKYYFEKPGEARKYFEKILATEKNDEQMRKMAEQELEK